MDADPIPNWSMPDRPIPGIDGVNTQMPLAANVDTFQKVTEPYVRELRVHCYRMLGSMQDAEDVLQETLLAAWRGLATFEGRASMRTWLYRIATNRCLDARRTASRRPAKAWDVPAVVPEPTGLGEITWLEPFPDSLLPEIRYEQAEAVSLAFVTALQTLPPRQVAVLILRDVLDFHADEVADMLGSTLDAVNGLLKRARLGIGKRITSTDRRGPSADEDAVVARFVTAWEGANVDALVDLLTDDVFMSMPPIPYEYRGRDAVLAFCAGLFDAGRRFELVATRANGQPAFGAYLRSAAGRSVGVGLYVLAFDGDRISAMTRFEAEVLPQFDLPAVRGG